MAAPLLNFVTRGLNILKPTFCSKVSHGSILHIYSFSTGSVLFKKRSQLFSVRRFENLMTKKKKKFYFDPMNASELGKFNESNSISKKKRLDQQDSVKLRAYNTILFEHITDLVSSNYISEELEKLEVPILAVRMAGDLSVARVYWQASGSAETDDTVQAVLDRFAGKIRQTLISLHVLGNVPRVCFLKDKAAANIAEIDRLLATADMGPIYDEDEYQTEADPHASEWNDPHHDAFQKHKGSKHFEERDVWSNLEKSQGQYKGPNFFAVDHANALEQISNRRKQQETASSQEGFAPISDSVEQFKVLQRRKKSRKNKKIDDSVYRGQLQSEEFKESDDREHFVEDNDEQMYDNDEIDMDIEDKIEDEREMLDK